MGNRVDVPTIHSADPLIFPLPNTSVGGCTVLMKDDYFFVDRVGNHLAQSFFISNSSCKIYPTRSFEMPIVSAFSRTFIRRSSNTISCTCSIISGVDALFGRPSSGSSSKLVLPRLTLKSLN